jgi:hypothetical protein
VHYIVLAACFNTLITGHLHTRKTGARPTKDSCILCLGRLLCGWGLSDGGRSDGRPLGVKPAEYAGIHS